jgi:outer membrane protein insertion porin family
VTAHARTTRPAARPALRFALALASCVALSETAYAQAVDTWGSGETLAPPAAAPASPPPAPRAVAACDCTVDAAASDLAPLRYTLQGVAVRGNTRTSTRVVLRYLPFGAGDVIDVSDPELELARYRLLGTGYFRTVELSLEKGDRRGSVVLVVTVSERNTIVVNDVSMGLSADADTGGEQRALMAYGGVDVAETNLAGTGITLGGGVAGALDQFALRLRFLDPAFLGSPYMIAGTLLYTHANDFFGNADVRWADPERDFQRTDFAVARYRRFGGSLGVGRDLSVSTQAFVHYRLETIDAHHPLAASHRRGFDYEPIDFDVARGRSVLSSLRGVVQHDTRDHPFLPTRGVFATLTGEFALLPAALDYDYQRIELKAAHFMPLPFGGHVLELSMYGGAIAGHAPFFEQFYVGDFTDFLPDRLLGMNFDRRPPPNFLGTQIVEVRYGEYAAKLAFEYRIPLYRGRRSIYGIDFFWGGGLYGVAEGRSITAPPTGYSGLAQLPIDVTANLGFRIDTSAGGFVFAFANALGFIPLRGQGPAGE